MNPADDFSYAEGVRQIARVLAEWLPRLKEPPRFRFPALPLIAEMREVNLAVNDTARELLALIDRRVFERTGGHPTVLQLQQTLKTFEVTWETCSLGELGLEAPSA